MRKPVQIATGTTGVPYGDDGRGVDINHTIYVLCDDGSVWELGKKCWQRLPNIPQDKPEQIVPPGTPHSLRFLRTEHQWGVEEHDEGYHMSVADIGALLDVVYAAKRVFASLGSGEQSVAVENLRRKLAVLEQGEPQ